MPVKILPHLRLLHLSLPVPHFSAMKPTNPSVKHYSSRVVPILSRMFPHKLKYHSLSTRLGLPKEYLGVRRFSTRGRSGSADGRASKSLVDDEAEISDWVSGLRSNSFQTRDGGTGSGSGRGRGSDRGRGRGRDERSGRDGGRFSSFKRQRDGDSDDYSASSRQTGRGSFPRERTRFGGKLEGNDEGFGSRRRENDWQGEKNSTMSRRGGRASEFGYGLDRGGGGRGNGRGTGGFRGGGKSMQRGGLLSSEEEIGDDDDDEGEGRLTKRGGRGSEFGYGLDRGGEGRGSGRGGGGLRGRGKNMQRGGLLTSDEEIGDDDDEEGEGRLTRRGGRGSDFRQDRGGRGDRSNGSGGLKGSGKSLQRAGFLTSDEEISDDDEGEGRLTKRGEKGSDIRYGKDRGRRGGMSNGSGGLKASGKSSRKGGVVTSEEEISGDDEESDGRLMKSFGDMISEEDSEDDSEEEEEDGDDMLKSAGSLFPGKKGASSQSVPSSPGRNDSYLSETRFDQCSVSPSSLKAIKDAGYEAMTVVQAATLPVILKGKDVLAKAKTGTGKTVAFLLPSIEVVVKAPPADRDQKRPPIFVLVICPTRELASQAAAEANTLLKYHPSLGVQVVIGGTRLGLEQKRMQANPCQILIATPGRLKDHIENTPGFATRLMGLKVLVLDEADHLLDMGFRKDIERIIASVPKQRQTLLFSATVPNEVRQICHIALKRDHEFIDTVGEGTEETNSQVSQMHLVAPLDKHFPLLYVLLKDHISDDVDYKVLVFCTTAMVTRLVADLLGELTLNVREIHSRKPQSYRTRVSDEFRKSKGLILVTSDVSARGVDYPDVTLVIQVGLPSDREQYVHRLGRTGRKGKEGQGILLLAPWEESFLSSIKDLPIAKAPIPTVDPETRKKVERALSHVEMKNKEAAYQAWLGYYNSNKIVGRDKYRLVELANEFSRCMGLDNPPAIPKLILGKMGLKNIPGLRCK